MTETLKNPIFSEEVVYLSKHIIEQPEIEVVSNNLEKDQENYEQAYTNGFNKGVEVATLDLKEQSETLNNLIKNIKEEVDKARLSLSKEIADIILIIVKQFFINQQQDESSILNQVTQVLSSLNEKQNIELHIHPKDLNVLQLSSLNLNMHEFNNLSLVPDESLCLGGCVIKSKHGVFNASIEQQIENLKQVLLKIKNI